MFSISDHLRPRSLVHMRAEFIASSNKVFPPASSYEPGLPLKVALSPQTVALVNKIMPELVALMQTDYDRMVVLATTEGLEPLLLEVGPGAIADCMSGGIIIVLAGGEGGGFGGNREEISFCLGVGGGDT